MIVTEIDRTSDRQVRAIGVFDSWLWRNVDPYPTELTSEFLMNRYCDPEEMALFEKITPTVSVEEAIVASMGPRPTRGHRVDPESFDRTWRWLAAQASLPPHRAGRPNYD